MEAVHSTLIVFPRVCRYDVHTNRPLTLSWAFQPLSNDMEEEEEVEEDDEDGKKISAVPSGKKSKPSTAGLDSVARIHSIKVTNTLGGGATQCLACPKGLSEKG